MQGCRLNNCSVLPYCILGIVKHHRLRLGSLVDPSTKNGKISYAKLMEECQSRTSLGHTGVEFTYQDTDGDLCVITSTEDLMEAIQQFHETKGFLKLVASVSSGTKQGGIRTPGAAPDSGVEIPAFRFPQTASESGVISNGSVASRMLRALYGPNDGESSVCDDGPEDLEEADPEIIRSHLLEDFQDHVNLDRTPAFFTGPTKDNSSDEPVFAMYTINEKACKSRFFAMDDIYVDLTEPPDPYEGYVGFAIPALFMERITADSLHYSPELPPSLDPVTAAFDPDHPPMVVSYREKLDASGNPTGCVEVTQEGTLMEILQSTEHKHFYRCTGVFEAVVCTTNDSCGSTDKSIALRLEELIVFEACDDILDALKNGNL